MGHRSKKRPGLRGAHPPESITITIVPNRDAPGAASSENPASAGSDGRETSLLLKKGECINFDVCTSGSPNSGYELTTTDFDICLGGDKRHGDEQGIGLDEGEHPLCRPSGSAEALQQIKPFDNCPDAALKQAHCSGGGCAQAAPKLDMRMAPGVRGADSVPSSALAPSPGHSGGVKSLTARLAKLIGVDRIMERPGNPAPTEQTQGGSSAPPGNGVGGIGRMRPAETPSPGRESGVFDEVLIKPSTVSGEYAKRLSDICTQLFNRSCGNMPEEAPVCPVADRPGGCGIRVKEIIDSVFAPREEAPKALPKVVIPERSIPFETLMKIYESK